MNRKYEAVIGLIFTFYYLLFCTHIHKNLGYPNFFPLNYELNIGHTSLSSVIFYIFALLTGGQEEMQRMQLENQRETLRIQREEMQRAARLQTETSFMALIRQI